MTILLNLGMPRALAIRFGQDEGKPQDAPASKPAMDLIIKQRQADDKYWPNLEAQAKVVEGELAQWLTAHGITGCTTRIVMPTGDMKYHFSPSVVIETTDLDQAEAITKKWRSLKKTFTDVSISKPTSRRTKALMKEIKAVFKQEGFIVHPTYIPPSPPQFPRPMLYIGDTQDSLTHTFGKQLDPILKNLSGATPGSHYFYPNVVYKGHDLLATHWGMNPVSTFKYKNHTVPIYTNPKPKK